MMSATLIFQALKCSLLFPSATTNTCRGPPRRRRIQKVTGRQCRDRCLVLFCRPRTRSFLQGPSLRLTSPTSEKAIGRASLKGIGVTASKIDTTANVSSSTTFKTPILDADD
ncbi:hypothetical protein EDD85DRAFT_3962 [Armillaria nabsnona]|nr:hypothetical protein EDD85DRAFT_3962 [Armillaria nabsnona]